MVGEGASALEIRARFPQHQQPQVPPGTLGLDRGELLIWPPNSPDLSPLDYSIWHKWDQLVKAELKDVRATPATLRAAIVAAHSKLPLEDVQASIRHWPKRLAACVKAKGSQFEHML